MRAWTRPASCALGAASLSLAVAWPKALSFAHHSDLRHLRRVASGDTMRRACRAEITAPALDADGRIRVRNATGAGRSSGYLDTGPGQIIVIRPDNPSAPGAVTASVRAGGPLFVVDGAVYSATSQDFLWLGDGCTASVMAIGSVTPTADERSVVVGDDGSFTALERGTTDRDFRAWSFRGQQFRYLKVNSNVVHIGPDEERWIADMVLEYIRRTGAVGATRARAILRRGGPDALFAELAHIPRPAVRAAYLLAAIPDVSVPNDRPGYVERGADLLREADARTEFLSGIPAGWRADERVLAAIYRTASAIAFDDCLERILHAAEPSRPVAAQLRPSLDTLLSAFSAADHRRELRARYFGSP